MTGTTYYLSPGRVRCGERQARRPVGDDASMPPSSSSRATRSSRAAAPTPARAGPDGGPAAPRRPRSCSPRTPARRRLRRRRRRILPHPRGRLVPPHPGAHDHRLLAGGDGRARDHRRLAGDHPGAPDDGGQPSRAGRRDLDRAPHLPRPGAGARAHDSRLAARWRGPQRRRHPRLSRPWTRSTSSSRTT